MVKYLAIVLAMLLPVNAFAARKFLTGFEFCRYDSSVAQYIFDSVSSTGAIVNATTSPRLNFCSHDSYLDRGASCSVNADCDVNATGDGLGTCISEPRNDCYLSFTPTAAAPEWAKLGSKYFTAGSTMATHILLNVSSTSTTSYDLVSFLETSVTGCFLRLEQGDTSSEYKAVMYYRDTNHECNGGTNDGTECTSCLTTADCTAGFCVNAGADTGACSGECTADTFGEQWCIPNQISSTSTLQIGRWYELVLGQDNTAGTSGQVQCELWEGGFQRGIRTKTEGFCGSTCSNTGDACTADTDCSGCTGTLCDTSNIANITDVQIGMTSPPDGWSFAIDDLVLDDAVTTGMTTMRIADATPNGNTVTLQEFTKSTGCTTHSECVDDLLNGTLDDGTTTLKPAIGTTETEQVELSNITLTTADATELSTASGVGLTVVVKDNNNKPSGNNKNLDNCMVDSADTQTNKECGSVIDISDHVNGNFDADVHSVITNQPDASNSPWTVATFNSAHLQMESPNTCTGLNCGNRITAAIAEVDVQMDSPALPGIAQDVNLDGTKRFCITGDSTSNTEQLHSLITGNLEDFDSILICTRGSKMEGDIENQITSILDGGTGGVMNCRYFKGNAGPCDYLMIIAGVNTINGSAPTPNSYCNGGTNHGKCCGSDCSSPATCTGGTCQYYATGYCRGGTNHGDPCVCTQNGLWITGAGFQSYCMKNSGGDWLAVNLGAACDDCTTNSDCLTNISCSTNSDCDTATCVSGECEGTCISSACRANQSPEYIRADQIEPIKWQWQGCVNAPGCSGGLCINANTLAEYQRSLRAILDVIDSRTETGTSCTNCKVQAILAPQPRTVDQGSGVADSFTAHGFRLDQIATLQRHIAQRESRHFVDLNSAFVLNATDKDQANLMGDAVHWNTAGIDQTFTQIERCVENKDGVSDGNCTSGVCTAGKIDDPCSTNSDCDLYNCSF